MIHPLILCGGAGTRLWPASRRARPKQFLEFVDGLSTFQLTLLRVAREGFAAPVVVTGAEHRFLVAEQAEAVDVDATILLEPSRRDSGPAFAAGAAYLAGEKGADAVLLALAADHLVKDADGFARTALKALPAAEAGRIVTFGIPPEGPSSAYGYVVPGTALEEGTGVSAVDRFVEKPDEAAAKTLIEGGALWNSGNFLTRADVLLSEYEADDTRRGESTVAAARRSVETAVRDLDFVRLDTDAFDQTAKRSIDFAVMEHTRLAALVKAEFDWTDIGGWDAMDRMLPTAGNGNAVSGAHVGVASKNCVVMSNGPLVATLGVENIAVVVTDDAVLVMDRAAGEKMRELVDAVKETAPTLVEEHRQSFRPWGNYRSLDMGKRHQVKRIVVKPGAALSLQHHHHRAEHWVVVTGTANVTVDGTVTMLRENESIYIPLGSVHRMENPGKIDLEIIEVQTGSYLGEDDIVRHQDVYQRT
ncbi:MAG: mannose-1-phosphate guanylyltransferase/mannose-6-phosphate isomerase [Pseudomonadota bacterium]